MEEKYIYGSDISDEDSAGSNARFRISNKLHKLVININSGRNIHICEV